MSVMRKWMNWSKIKWNKVNDSKEMLIESREINDEWKKTKSGASSSEIEWNWKKNLLSNALEYNVTITKENGTEREKGDANGRTKRYYLNSWQEKRFSVRKNLQFFRLIRDEDVNNKTIDVIEMGDVRMSSTLT